MRDAQLYVSPPTIRAVAFGLRPFFMHRLATLA